MALSRIRSLGTPLVCAALILTFIAPVTAGAITRAEVLARAQVWVKRAVPYSQARYATVGGTLISTSTANPSRFGYRTDCSGFVSMALGFTTPAGRPLSLSTATLDDVMVGIAKDDLLPGDVVLRPKDAIVDGRTVPYGHAVIFAGWLDESRTRYLGFHQSSSRKGAVAAQITWGVSGFYNDKGYAAYRCGLVRERTKIGPVVDR
jgi:hypothetical protein